MLKNKKIVLLFLSAVLAIYPVHTMNWKKIIVGAAVISAVAGGVYYLTTSNQVAESDDDENNKNIKNDCNDDEINAQEEKVNYEIARYNRENTIANDTCNIMAARSCECKLCNAYNKGLILRLLNDHREFLFDLLQHNEHFLNQFIALDVLEYVAQNFFTLMANCNVQSGVVSSDDDSNKNAGIALVKFIGWVTIKKELYSQLHLQNIVDFHKDPQVSFNALTETVEWFRNMPIIGRIITLFFIPNDYFMVKNIVAKGYDIKNFESLAQAAYIYFMKAGSLNFSHKEVQNKINFNPRYNKKLFTIYIRDCEKEIITWCHNHLKNSCNKKNNLNCLIDCADMFGHKNIYKELLEFRENRGLFRNTLHDTILTRKLTDLEFEYQ